MKRLATYLKTHNGIWISLLCVGLVIASFAMFLGTGVYALTTGTKATGNYISDRLMALGFICIAVILNFCIAWILGLQLSTWKFFLRFAMDAFATVFGAFLVFVMRPLAPFFGTSFSVTAKGRRH